MVVCLTNLTKIISVMTIVNIVPDSVHMTRHKYV